MERHTKMGLFRIFVLRDKPLRLDENILNKTVLMVGSPVEGLRTPPRLNERYRELGRDTRVEVREVTSSDLSELLGLVHNEASISGLLVTMPLKSKIIDHLDVISSVVDATRSCNCVRKDPDGRLVGASFDGFGLLSAILDSGFQVKDSRARLIGCGGAGRSIAAALVNAGVGELQISDIDGTAAADYAKRLNDLDSDSWIVTGSNTSDIDLLINASPVGMGAEDKSPATRSTIRSSSLVVDITAYPHVTDLLTIAQSEGKATINGQAMVGGQLRLIVEFLDSFVTEESVLL